jgi:hypothetical protein
MVVGSGALLAYWFRGNVSPYAIVFVSLSVGCLLIFQHTGRLKPFFYNAAFLLLALSLSELYFEFEETSDGAAYQHLRHDETLGYAAKPGVFRALKTYAFGRRVVYDVKYSIEPSGVRHTPIAATGPTAFFFGDSFMFGEGVNDDETLPFAFSVASGMRVVNFGLNGYGPHQMLRSLELDLPGRSGFVLPKFVVYLAIPQHIKRAAGYSAWDRAGPLYEVQNGRAQFVGSFRDKGRMSTPPSEPASLLDKLLNLSPTYRAWHPAPHYLRASDDAKTHARDKNRFLAVVLAAKAIVAERYRSPFVFILWERARASKEEKEDADWITSRLREQHIPILRVARAVKSPQFKDWIISRDGHPDARAYRYLAQELLKFLEQFGVGSVVQQTSQ